MRNLKAVFSALIVSLAGHTARAAMPELRSGDLIFQTSLSDQSKVIQRATGSKYSHVGIVEIGQGGQVFVIEAISKVSRTELDKWIARGSKGRFAVFRVIDLKPAKATEFIAAAKTYLGRPYDIFFTKKNDEIYCSELVDYAARDVGMELGRYQKFGSLDVNNPEVMDLARARWKGHPACRSLGSFEECWPRILDDEMVTPVSLTEDSRTRQIYSNY